jgi:hypothetical protein
MRYPHAKSTYFLLNQKIKIHIVAYCKKKLMKLLLKKIICIIRGQNKVFKNHIFRVAFYANSGNGSGNNCRKTYFTRICFK